MDNSGSIDGAEEDIMQAGAVSFVQALDVAPGESAAGLTSFADGAVLSQALTTTEATIIAAINAPFGNGSTNLEAGITTGQAGLVSGGDIKPDVMVVITDGNPTASDGPDSHEVDAFNAAAAAKLAGTTIYVVGIGADVNGAYLQTIATSPAHYFPATNFADLQLALLTIANCGEVPMGTLTVNKVVSGGQFAGAEENFSFQVDGGAATAFEADGTNGPFPVTAISHTVTEVVVTDYTPTYSNSVNGNANCNALLVPDGGNVTCTITNTFVPPPTDGTLTVNKVRVGGFGLQATTTFQFIVNGGAPTNFQADGSNDVVVPIGPYTVTEVADSDFTTAYSAGCSGSMTAGGATCTITNTANSQNLTLLNVSFGTGTDQSDISDWTDGSDTIAREGQVSGEDITSPDGGRFAKIEDGESICQAVSSAGFHSLALKYYWKGDASAEDGETGSVQYRTSGTSCSSATTAATHELDDGNNDLDEGWSSLQSAGLPDGVTVIRFLNNSDNGSEEFRIDGVVLTGIPN